MGFTHLHVHTEYSLLDGAARIKDVVAKARELGMTSLAITDHGVMFGVIDFYRECIKNGIKPIIGCEVYTAARTMDDKDAEKDKHQGHLVLLAKDNTGYHNLIKIVSESYTRGFYYKPRVDKELLRRYSEGIIALSACLAGNIPRFLMQRNYEAAKQEAVERVLAHLGQPYDWYYLPGNGRAYCSELVEESYLYADSTRIFPAKPMRFRAADGTMPQFWTDLFHRLGAGVPEGEPGTNPNDMSRFCLLHTVRVFR